MYTNLTVLLSALLIVNALDLECSVDTIEQLFLPPSEDKKCELCEILKTKLDITHCQSNLLPTPCVANPQHHLLLQQFTSFNHTEQYPEHYHQQSVHWDKTLHNSNNNGQPVFHVLIKRSNNQEDQDEYLYLTFNTYPKILPKICEQRKDPVQAPFGHLCAPHTKCVEDEKEADGYTCQCEDKCNKTWLLRKILEWVQIVCIVVCCIFCFLIYWLRKTKPMSVAMWPITESVLFGCILIYISVILRIEIPNNTAMLCLIEPWTRELGFTLAYGGIILKIYRSLVEFRTRKAHRWVVREKDIVRYLCTMTCVVVFYMTSWTVTNKYYSGVDGEKFYDHLYCPTTWWHRVTNLGEVIFLLVGLNMAWHLRRTSVSPFKNFYTASLLIETITNVLGFIIGESRHLMVEDDEVFLMILHFVRCQLTTTIIIFLVVAPKLYYIRDDKRKRQLRRGDTTTSGIGAGRKALEAAINNGDLDFADINISDMDPQDIRLELKRVYTQLEHLRNKTMRKDNPHISKRRGGRKPTHRRFSLQALRRQQQAQHYQPQHPPQRSFRGGYTHDDIEDSVCSIEGPSTYSEAGR